MTIAIDGSKPLNGSITFISETVDSITIRIEAGTVPSTKNNIPILLQMNARSVSADSTLFDAIFTELTTNWDKLYVKDSSVNQSLYTDTWDDTDKFARVWVVLDQLTTAQKDLVIEFDNTSSANRQNKWIGVNIEDELASYAGLVTSLSPVDYWRLGETSGTAAVSEITATDGTYTGGYTLDQTSLLVGDNNPCVLLDGTNGYIDTNTTAYSFDKDDAFSVCFLLNMTTLSTNSPVISNLTTTTPLRGFQIHTQAQGQIHLLFISTWTSDAMEFKSASSVIGTGTTYHVCMTKDTSNTRGGVTLYIDGTAINMNYSLASSLTGTMVSPINLSIGGRRGYMNGDVDEVCIFDKELTSTEVTSLYNMSV